MSQITKRAMEASLKKLLFDFLLDRKAIERLKSLLPIIKKMLELRLVNAIQIKKNIR